jgi:hypothetical protein
MDKEEARLESAHPVRTLPHLYMELLELMRPRETVGTAMRRFGNINKISNSGDNSGSATSSDKTSTGTGSTGTGSTVKVDVSRMTDILDALIAHGVTNAYSLTYTNIESQIIQWEYMDLSGQIQGPFPDITMRGWVKAGFFDVTTSTNEARGSGSVRVRKVYPSLPLADATATVDPDAAAAGDSKKRRVESTSKPNAKRSRPNTGTGTGTDDLMADLGSSSDEEEEEEEEEVNVSQPVSVPQPQPRRSRWLAVDDEDAFEDEL